MNSLVVSQPMALFLARERVFMIFPDGKTTVALTMYSPFMLPNRTAAVPEPPQPITAMESAYLKQVPFDNRLTASKCGAWTRTTTKISDKHAV